VAWGLIDFHHIGEILRVSRSETAVLAATWIATLTVQLEFAIYIGVALSLLLYLKRTSQPGVDDVKPVPGQVPPAFSAATGLPDCPQLKIVRFNGSIFFGAVNHLQEAMQAIDAQNPAHVHVLLAASGINFVDMGGAQWLAQEAQRRRSLGGGLYIFHMKDEPLAMLRKSGAFDAIGAENFFTLGDDLMPAIKARLNPQTCAQCTVRVFAPCK
jgi:sulfate permease, SulP family